jgi:hypothetical protein
MSKICMEELSKWVGSVSRVKACNKSLVFSLKDLNIDKMFIPWQMNKSNFHNPLYLATSSALQLLVMCYVLDELMCK